MAAALVLLAALAQPLPAPAEAAGRSAGTKGSGAAPAVVPAPPARYRVDLVMTGEGQSSTMKEFHHDGMVRREMAVEGETVTFIERPDRKVSYTIMASQGMYVETSLAEPPPGVPAETVIAAEAGSDMKIEPMGTEVIKGQLCDKSRVVSGGRAAYMWVSRDTRLPVRAQDETMLAEWNNYEAGAQPAGLFEPPSGYHEFQMPGMGSGAMSGMMGGMAGQVKGQPGMGGMPGTGGMRIFVSRDSPLEMSASGKAMRGMGGMAMGEARARTESFGGQFGGKVGLAAGGPVGMIVGQYVGRSVAGYIFGKGQEAVMPGR